MIPQKLEFGGQAFEEVMPVTAEGRTGGLVRRQVRGYNDNTGNCPFGFP